jgi:hypothetical protein
LIQKKTPAWAEAKALTAWLWPQRAKPHQREVVNGEGKFILRLAYPLAAVGVKGALRAVESQQAPSARRKSKVKSGVAG